MRAHVSLPLLALAFLLPAALSVAEDASLAIDPSLSPDGAQLAFSWRGDVWMVDSHGGKARRLTAHPARDMRPVFSPDGRRIALVSDRSGRPQIYLIDADGGSLRQVTFHSEGSRVEDWYPDGKALLTSGLRDAFYGRYPDRLFRVEVTRRAAERPLFDGTAYQGNLSPDDRRLLFVRE
ncbi:MAG: PD40 domain-containing protein, partial [Pirellulales bacterium]|nr:PD40 domain-containing protein [Pirellulales bacterium]